MVYSNVVQTMWSETNKLHNRIMRRVYYAFFVRAATHPILVQVALFALALLVFARMVHVRSVIDNMLATKVGSLPSFFAGALSNGEALTLIALGVMLFTLLSVPLRIRAEFAPRARTA